MNKKRIGIVGILILSTAILSSILFHSYFFNPLTPAKDSYISVDDPSEANGKEEDLVIEYDKHAVYLLFEIENHINYMYAYLTLSFLSISEDMEFSVYIMYDTWDENNLTYNNRPGPHWYDSTINFSLTKQGNPSILLDLTPYVNDKSSMYTDSISIVIEARSEGKAIIASKESKTDTSLPIIHWSPTIFNLPYVIVICVIIGIIITPVALGLLTLYDKKQDKKFEPQHILMVKKDKDTQKEDTLPSRLISREHIRTYKVGLRAPESLIAPYTELVAKLEVLKCHRRFLNNNTSYGADVLFSKKLANASKEKREYYQGLLEPVKPLTDSEADHQIREVKFKLALLKASEPMFTNMTFTRRQIRDLIDPDTLTPTMISLKDYQYVAGESLKIICTHFNTRALTLTDQIPLSKTELVNEAVRKGALKGKLTSAQSYKSTPAKAIEDIVDLHANIDQMAFYQMANAYEAFYTLAEKVDYVRSLLDPNIQTTADFSDTAHVLLSYYSIPAHLRTFLAKHWKVDPQWVRNTLVGWRRKLDPHLPDKFQIEAVRENFNKLAQQYQSCARNEGEVKVISILQKRQVLHLLSSKVIDLSPLLPSELHSYYLHLKDVISNLPEPPSLEGAVIRITPQEFTDQGQRLRTEAQNVQNTFPQGSRPYTNIQSFINKIDLLLQEVSTPKIQKLLHNYIVGNRYTKSMQDLLKTSRVKHLFTALRGILSNTLAAKVPSAIGQLIRFLDPELCLTRPFKSDRRERKALPAELIMNKYIVERKGEPDSSRHLPNRYDPKRPLSRHYNATEIFSRGRPIWLGINIYTPSQLRDGLIQGRRKGIFWFQLIPSKKIIKCIQKGAQVRHIRLNPPKGPTRKIIADIVLASDDASVFIHEHGFLKAFDREFPHVQIPKGEYVGVDFNRISEYMVAVATEAQEIDILPMMSLYKDTAERLEHIRTEQIPGIQRKLSSPNSLSNEKRKRLEAQLNLLHQRQGRLRKEMKHQSLMIYLYVAHKTDAKHIAWDGIQGISTRGTKGKLAMAVTNLPKRKALYDEFIQWASDLKREGFLPQYVDTHVMSPYTSQICSECFKSTRRASKTLRKGIPYDEFECTECKKHSNRHSNAAHVNALQLQHHVQQLTLQPISSNDG